MSVLIKSNNTFMGDLNSLPSVNAPLPNGASLYADFKRQIYINTLAGEITKAIARPLTVMSFSRETGASLVNASGDVEYVSQNIPRFDYDVTDGAMMGLLLEGATTNQVRNSAELNASANYSVTGATVTQADGGFYRLTASADNSSHYLQDLGTNASVTSALNGAISVYAREGTGRYLQIIAPELGVDVYANFDLKTGKITKTGKINRAQIERGIKGSWRCILAFLTPTVNTVTTIRYAIINRPDAVPGASYAGAGQSIQLALPQMELRQTFATSIVSPPSGVKTRSGDELFLKHNLSSLSSFTLFLSAKMTRNEQGPGSANTLAYISNTSTGKGFSLGIASAQLAFPYALFLSIAGDTSSTNYPKGPRFFPLAPCQVALRVSGNTLTVLTDGNEPETYSIAGTAGLDSIKLGSTWGGWLEKSVFYPVALSDLEMKKTFDQLF